MNFNEFHNSAYWERQRKLKAGQITLQQLALVFVGSIAFFWMMYLAIFLEG